LALAKDLPPAMDLPCLVMDGKSAVAIASNVLAQLPEEEAEKQEGPGHLPDDTADPELTQEDPEKQKSPPRRPGYVEPEVPEEHLVSQTSQTSSEAPNGIQPQSH
ncbi:MAG: hypothetical protein GY696_02160, partial [Gammaproteobacteria bacterium]|nr:hypothetical protein [Gammaproteobacteria bacterium]